MTPNFIVCHENQKLAEASQLIKKKNKSEEFSLSITIAKLLVGDIANSSMDEERTGEVLQGISQSRT